MVQTKISKATLHQPASTAAIRNSLMQDGVAVLRDCYSDAAIDDLLQVITAADPTKPTFRRTAELFAIRQFLKEIPEAAPIVLNPMLGDLIGRLCGAGYFVAKSIYFDKPQGSNWFVAYHQDLSISVDRRSAFEGFGPWTVKQDQFSVQPPLLILEDNITVRIHLDDTTAKNGALRVVPGSHLKGIYRPETIDWTIESEVVCEVPKGGIMIMRPLLLHASGRTTNNQPRRVVHLEFSRIDLPDGLNWSEQRHW